jgi:hypothetical protein
MARDEARAIAEHEAAHVLVAWGLGVYVASTRINPRGFGATLVDPATPTIDAAISAAGDVWDSELSDQPYRDGSCGDLLAQLELVGSAGIWHARRTARGILNARHHDVLHVASRLRRENALTFTRVVPGVRQSRQHHPDGRQALRLVEPRSVTRETPWSAPSLLARGPDLRTPEDAKSGPIPLLSQLPLDKP